MSDASADQTDRALRLFAASAVSDLMYTLGLTRGVDMALHQADSLCFAVGAGGFTKDSSLRLLRDETFAKAASVWQALVALFDHVGADLDEVIVLAGATELRAFDTHPKFPDTASLRETFASLVLNTANEIALREQEQQL